MYSRRMKRTRWFEQLLSFELSRSVMIFLLWKASSSKQYYARKDVWHLKMSQLVTMVQRMIEYKLEVNDDLIRYSFFDNRVRYSEDIRLVSLWMLMELFTKKKSEALIIYIFLNTPEDANLHQISFNQTYMLQIQLMSRIFKKKMKRLSIRPR